MGKSKVVLLLLLMANLLSAGYSRYNLPFYGIWETSFTESPTYYNGYIYITTITKYDDSAGVKTPITFSDTEDTSHIIKSANRGETWTEVVSYDQPDYSISHRVGNKLYIILDDVTRTLWELNLDTEVFISKGNIHFGDDINILGFKSLADGTLVITFVFSAAGNKTLYVSKFDPENIGGITDYELVAATTDGITQNNLFIEESEDLIHVTWKRTPAFDQEEYEYSNVTISSGAILTAQTLYSILDTGDNASRQIHSVSNMVRYGGMYIIPITTSVPDENGTFSMGYFYTDATTTPYNWLLALIDFYDADDKAFGQEVWNVKNLFEVGGTLYWYFSQVREKETSGEWQSIYYITSTDGLVWSDKQTYREMLDNPIYAGLISDFDSIYNDVSFSLLNGKVFVVINDANAWDIVEGETEPQRIRVPHTVFLIGANQITAELEDDLPMQDSISAPQFDGEIGVIETCHEVKVSSDFCSDWKDKKNGSDVEVDSETCKGWKTISNIFCTTD